MDLDNAPGQRVWAYRKAAWAIEDLDVDIGVPLPADGAASRGTGEDRECWAEAGGGGRGSDQRVDITRT